MKALFLRFLRDESARGLSEVLLIAGTASIVIPSMEKVGTRLSAVFEKLVRALH